jgi:hypothetical protein
MEVHLLEWFVVSLIVAVEDDVVAITLWCTLMCLFALGYRQWGVLVGLVQWLYTSWRMIVLSRNM